MLIGAGVLAACAAIPLWSALWGERVVFWRDVHLLWLPQIDVVARTLAEGAWPVWDRFTGFGRPLLADPRAALFYPPTWLAVLAPPGLAYAWLAAFHLFVAGCGTVALARRLGASPPAALLAGATFTASGPLVSLVLMWHQLAGAAWVPALLAAFHHLAEVRDHRRLALAAGLLGLQVLAGSPEYTAMAVLAIVLITWPAHLAGGARAPALRRLVALTLAGGLGLALAAVQWLPAARYAENAARLSRPSDPAIWALAPPLLAETLLTVRAADLPLTPAATSALLGGREPLLPSIYLGPGLWILALAGLTAPGGAAGRLGLLGLASTCVALGPHTPLLALAQALVPPLAGLRYPAKALVFTSLALALLAGLGFDRLAQASAAANRAGRLAAYVAIAFAALVATGPVVRPWLRDPGAIAAIVAAAAVAALLAGLAAVLGAVGARPWARGLLALLAVLPPLVHHRGLIETAPARLFQARPELLRHLDPAATGRLYAYDYLIVNDWQRITSPHAPRALVPVRGPDDFDTRVAWVAAAHAALHPPTAARFGLAGSFDHDVLDFEPTLRAELATWLRASEAAPAHLRLLRLGAVTHAIGLGPAAWWRGLKVKAQVPGLTREPVTLLEVPDPMPRAWAVGAVRVAPGGAALGALAAADFDPRREAVLAPAAAAAIGLPVETEPFTSEVQLTTLRGDHVALDATLSRPGLVVLADAWDAGWHASVDDVPAPVLAANVAFRAVPVGAGRHRVELRYVPPGLAAGALISALAAVALILVARAGQPA